MSGEREITPASDEWPRLLRESPAPPKRLFACGLPIDPEAAGIAVVGTRHPTVAGVEVAASLAEALAQAGFLVVSGLARGIDAVAHRSAIDAGGSTVAVVGAGLDVDYPRANRQLRRRIEEVGSVLSEHPSGTEPRPHHFPQRNRVIAGITLATVVVEGGPRSGALITARYALEANRSVFAVPGSVRNPMAVGPNALIKRSEATALTEPSDLFAELAPSTVWAREPDHVGPSGDLGEEEAQVLGTLDDVAVLPTRLMSVLEIQPGRLSLVLARLEVQGLVARDGPGYRITSAGARLRSARGDDEGD